MHDVAPVGVATRHIGQDFAKGFGEKPFVQPFNGFVYLGFGGGDTALLVFRWHGGKGNTLTLATPPFMRTKNIAMLNKIPLLLLPVLVIVLASCQNNAEVDPTQEAPPKEEAPALITDESAAVPLEALHFIDSAALLSKLADSPTFFYEVQTIIPHSEDSILNRKIMRTLGRVIAGDEYPMVPTDHALHLRAAARLEKRAYLQQDIDTADIVDIGASTYSEDHSYTTSVYLNERGLLTVGTGYYAYTGGAHGNYDQVLQTFVVRPPTLLTPEAIFLPESGSAIAKMLTDSLAISHEELAITIETPTKNIGLLKQGIVFNHPPYGIGPWAAGEIEVTISYTDLAPYLTEEVKGLVTAL